MLCNEAVTIKLELRDGLLVDGPKFSHIDKQNRFCFHTYHHVGKRRTYRAAVLKDGFGNEERIHFPETLARWEKVWLVADLPGGRILCM